MARSVSKRILATGVLVTESPLHVGTGAPSPETDLPLARDGAGRLYVPGTSLAGAFRNWCVDTLKDHEETLLEIWGPLLKRPSLDDEYEIDNGWASYLFVDDSPVHPPGGEDTFEIRDGVAIDREWGVAATRFKFDRAVLPKGTRFQLSLSLELPPEGETEAKEVLRHLLHGLNKGKVRLGACKTRGMGRVRFVELPKVRIQDFGSRGGIFDILRDEGSDDDTFLKTTTSLTTTARPQLDVKVKWRAVGPVMVKSGSDGLLVDMLPLLSGIDGQMAPVIPGSSLKGIVRSHAERIMRTVLPECDDSSQWPKDGYKRFPAQLAKVHLVNAIFGAPGRPQGNGSDQVSHEPLPGLGALAVDDCYANPITSVDDFFALDSVESETELRQHLIALGKKDWTQAYHVAIDRWTGGVAENFLYTVLEPHGENWAPFELSLNLDRIPSRMRCPAVVLLLLTVRDLSAGRLPIGFAGNRGMGEIRVDEIVLSGATDDTIELGSLPITLAGGDISNLGSTVLDDLTKQWQDWLGTHRGTRIS